MALNLTRENHMDIFEYKVESIGGVFTSRATKFVRLQARCVALGKRRWELVSVTYDWFTGEYLMFFKRIQPNKTI